MKENLIIKEYKEVQTVVEKGREVNRNRNYTTFRCHCCNKEITVLTRSFSLDKPCTNCQKRARGARNFMQRAVDKFGDKFDLSKTVYVDSSTKLSVRCIKHDNTFEVHPMDFVGKPRKNKPQKGGCKLCAAETQAQAMKKPISYYLQALNTRFPQFSVVSHGTAESNRELMHLMCEHHGPFSKTLHNIVSKEAVHLCPGCNNDLNAWKMRTVREDVAGKVYFVFLPELNMFKFGVTYRDIADRVKEFKQTAELLWYVDFDTLSDAYFFEYQFFRYYKELRYKGERVMNSGGYTELFTEIINKPTKRFIEEILCLKESKRGTPEH